MESVGALGQLAAQAGPWLFLCVVLTWVVWHTRGEVIKLHERRADDFKAALDAEVRRGEVRDKQVEDLLDGHRTVVSILRSIEGHASRQGKGTVTR